MKKISDYITTPALMARTHLVLVVLWIVLIPPSALWWSTSVPYLVFISVYAVIMGHISSWQSARVEQRQDDDDNVAEATEHIEELKELIKSRLPEVKNEPRI